MALPNTNISVAMVKAELGASTNDVGRLCIHLNINKWSKWKPVRHGSVNPITEAQLRSTNYGISLPIYDSINDLINGISGVTGSSYPTWQYLKPSGGLPSPYRLSDFNNYDKSAMIPFGLFGVTQQVNKTGSDSIVMGIIGFTDGTPTRIGLDDFDFGDRQFAMIYRPVGSTTYKTVIAPKGQFSVDLDVVTEDLELGFYEAFLCMTNNSGNFTGGILGFEGHPKPDILTGDMIFAVVSQTVIVSVTAIYDTVNRNNVIIQVWAYNDTVVPVSLLSCVLQVRNSQNECDSTIQQNEVYRNIGNKTAAIGETLIHSETITINRDFYPMWKVCWRNSGAYPQSFGAAIIQEMD